MRKYNNNNNNNNNCIYSTYIQYIQTIQNLTGSPITFRVSNKLWSEFLKVIRKESYKANRSEILRKLIAEYCIKYGQDKTQTNINVFINQAEKVKISKSKVVVKTERPLTDYSKFTFEELEVKYAQADRVERTRILFELQQRGINIRDFQRKKEGLR